MPLDLTDRVCLITGAAGGIGHAVAVGFAKRNATVIATDLQPPICDSAAACLAWDVTDPDQARQTVAHVLDRFGRIDALVANAGHFPRHAWDQLTAEIWQQVLEVNLLGPWHGAHAVADAMISRGYGKIVTVASIQVRLGPVDQIPYTSAKAGVLAMTRSLARTFGPHGIRVNCVMPGAIWSPGALDVLNDQQLKQRQDHWAKQQCLPQPLTAQGIEPTFAFLCSDESDAITGQVLCCDHGALHW